MKTTKSIFRVLKITLGFTGRICTSSLEPLLLLLWILPAVVQAQSYTNSYGIWTYTTTNNSITITGYTGPGGDVTIPDRIPDTTNGLLVTSIGDNAFANGTTLLASVTIPNSVTKIGDNAFGGCTSLTNVTIPSSLTSIGGYSFSGCTSLTNVTIPNSVTNIGWAAFMSCTSLTGVTIGNGVSRIVDYTFYECTNLTNVTIGNGVTSIAMAAFQGCTSLTTITIPNSVTDIEDGRSGGPGGAYRYGAFLGCTSLTNVMIPNSVTNIGSWAFCDCSSLASVTIPNSVSRIGNSAFSGCSSLASVTIPNSVTDIEDGLQPGPGGEYTSGAFLGCTGLTAITVDALNSAYTSLDGVLFDKSQTTLIKYPEGKAVTSYTIPNSVTSIGPYAFAYCSGLTSVTIPDSVTSIVGYTFWYCTSLTNVTIPDSVASIGDVAFQGCTSLTSIYFKGNAPNGDEWVFYGDNNTTVYYLPGTTGWSTNFAGVPTALWLPQVQTTDAYFGVWADQFGFTINWTSGMTVVVEASTNMANPSWVPLETHTFRGNSWFFSDPDWANYPSRFYRIRSL